MFSTHSLKSSFLRVASFLLVALSVASTPAQAGQWVVKEYIRDATSSDQDWSLGFDEREDATVQLGVGHYSYTANLHSTPRYKATPYESSGTLYDFTGPSKTSIGQTAHEKSSAPPSWFDGCMPFISGVHLGFAPPTEGRSPFNAPAPQLNPTPDDGQAQGDFSVTPILMWIPSQIRDQDGQMVDNPADGQAQGEFSVWKRRTSREAGLVVVNQEDNGPPPTPSSSKTSVVL